jgi:hypothetical protein
VFSVSTESRPKRDGSSPSKIVAAKSQKLKLKKDKINVLQPRVKGTSSQKSSVNLSQPRGTKIRIAGSVASGGLSSVKSGISASKVYKPDDLIIIPYNFENNHDENLESTESDKNIKPKNKIIDKIVGPGASMMNKPKV